MIRAFMDHCLSKGVKESTSAKARLQVSKGRAAPKGAAHLEKSSSLKTHMKVWPRLRGHSTP